MKNTFFEHHVKYVDKLEIIKNGTIFLDANALLNLYRLSNKNREKLFEILDTVKDRIYLSNQVGKEFYKNRNNVMYQKSKLKENLITELSSDIQKIINKIENVNFTSKYKISCNLLKHEHELQEQIKNNLSEAKNNISKSIDDYDIFPKSNDFLKEDEVLTKITEIFKGKVIKPMDKSTLDEIYIEGKSRYEKKIPPGYEDTKDKEEPDRYGDLVIWKELIQFAKDNKTDVLFVSDDRKEDWCELLRKNEDEGDRKSNKIDIGTRVDLIKEFREESNQLFYSITTEEFIREISRMFNIYGTENLEHESEVIRRDLQTPSLNKTTQREILKILENEDCIYKSKVSDQNSSLKNFLSDYSDSNLKSYLNDFLFDRIIYNIQQNPEIFTSKNIGANIQSICPVCECERTFEIIEDGKVKCLECQTEMKLDLKVNIK